MAYIAEDNRHSFKQLQWTFPIALTLHNAEEWIWLPSWVATHSTELPWRISATYFRLGLLIVTVAAYLITWLSVKFGLRNIWTYLFIAFVASMLLNVLVPHLPATILFRGYTPGVVTAVTVILPITVTLLNRVRREHIIPNISIAAVVFGIPLLLAAVAAGLFATRLRLW